MRFPKLKIQNQKSKIQNTDKIKPIIQELALNFTLQF